MSPRESLAYLGTLPFAAGFLLPLLGMTQLPVLGDVPQAALLYGVVIVSFMAGVHWGQHLSRPEQVPAFFLLASNAVALTAWFAAWLLPLAGAYAVLAGLFVVLWALDVRWARALALPQSYLQMRGRVTTIVTILLLGMTVLAC